MPWVRLDDEFPENPKIARLSNDALALWVVGLAYCNRNLTDGFIPYQVGLGQLRYCNGNTVPAIRELEGVGLWDESEDGWWIHDFEHYQPSKADVLELREKRAEAGRKGGKRSGEVRKEASRQAKPEANHEASALANGKQSMNPVPVPVPVPVPELRSVDEEIYEGNGLDVGEYVDALADSDEKTPAILKALRKELPEAAFRNALEALELRRAASDAGPLVSETRYFVATLASMKREGQYA